MDDFSRVAGALIIGTVPLVLMAIIGEFWAWLTGPSLYVHGHVQATGKVVKRGYDYEYYRRLDDDTPSYTPASGKAIDQGFSLKLKSP